MTRAGLGVALALIGAGAAGCHPASIPPPPPFPSGPSPAPDTVPRDAAARVVVQGLQFTGAPSGDPGSRPGFSPSSHGPPGLPPGFSLGISLDQVRFPRDVHGGRRLGFSLRGVGIQPGVWTTEFALGTLLSRRSGDPESVNTELGFAHNAPLWRSHVLFRLGATGQFAFAEGRGGYVGAYGGVGLLARLRGRAGIRLDVTRSYLHLVGRYFLGVTTISVGLATIPRVAGAAERP